MIISVFEVCSTNKLAPDFDDLIGYNDNCVDAPDEIKMLIKNKREELQQAIKPNVMNISL